MDTVVTVIEAVSVFLTAVIAALVIIAPWTKSDKDDKVLGFLQWLEEKLLLIIAPVQTLRAKAEKEKKAE